MLLIFCELKYSMSKCGQKPDQCTTGHVTNILLVTALQNIKKSSSKEEILGLTLMSCIPALKGQDKRYCFTHFTQRGPLTNTVFNKVEPELTPH